MKSVLISELVNACAGDPVLLTKVNGLLALIKADRVMAHKETAARQREQNKRLLEAGRKALGLEK